MIALWKQSKWCVYLSIYHLIEASYHWGYLTELANVTAQPRRTRLKVTSHTFSGSLTLSPHAMIQLKENSSNIKLLTTRSVVSWETRSHFLKEALLLSFSNIFFLCVVVLSGTSWVTPSPIILKKRQTFLQLISPQILHPSPKQHEKQESTDVFMISGWTVPKSGRVHGEFMLAPESKSMLMLLLVC